MYVRDSYQNTSVCLMKLCLSLEEKEHYYILCKKLGLIFKITHILTKECHYWSRK